MTKTAVAELQQTTGKGPQLRLVGKDEPLSRGFKSIGPLTDARADFMYAQRAPPGETVNGKQDSVVDLALKRSLQEHRKLGGKPTEGFIDHIVMPIRQVKQ
jgi:hypothetical protein